MERVMLENESAWGMLILIAIVVVIAIIVWLFTDPTRWED